MRFWWVNQNQTFRHEVPGGYLWSPKRSKNSRSNPFYEFMKEVSPGDVVFSFADTRIPAIGIALSNAYEAPKPKEFGQVGAYWDLVGWRINMRFTMFRQSIRPVDYIERLRPYLPKKYSPLQPNGSGLQSVYLTAVPELLAGQIIDLIGSEARSVIQSWTASDVVAGAALAGQSEWEEHQLNQLKANASISETEKTALVLSRRGQGVFRARVASVERRCRVTGATNVEYLRASHTKPWRDSSNAERLDGENGFLLTPDVDLLFDRGFLTFENTGKVLVSPVADRVAIEQMGITPAMLQNVGSFSEGQRKYLQFHRENIFLEAKVKLD
jgi:putative restriction endonuclease